MKSRPSSKPEHFPLLQTCFRVIKRGPGGGGGPQETALAPGAAGKKQRGALIRSVLEVVTCVLQKEPQWLWPGNREENAFR